MNGGINLQNSGFYFDHLNNTHSFNVLIHNVLLYA